MAANLIGAAQIYLGFGIVFGIVFLLVGIGRVEKNAAGAWAFRPLLLPGMALLWPLILWRLWILYRGWEEADRHAPPLRAQRVLGLTLAISVPIILAISLWIKTPDPTERPAILLIAPSEEEAQ